MSLILSIETSTTVCSVALGLDGKIISSREENQGNSHSEKLTGFIVSMMHESSHKQEELDAIAVSSGPGSFTGLRIGVSTAKGLCFALDKPLLSVSTLHAMAWGALQELRNSKHVQNSADRFLLCPMIDARRMEVYCAVFDEQLNMRQDIAAEIISPDSFSSHLRKSKVYFFGDGAEKCKEISGHHSNADFSLSLLASARFMVSLAEERFRENKTEDLSLFEPSYVKEFRVVMKK